MPKTTEAEFKAEAEARAAKTLADMLVKDLEDSQVSVPVQMAALTRATAKQLTRVGLGGDKLLPSIAMFLSQVVRHHNRENTSDG